MIRILVVEDDVLFNKTLCYNLSLAGYKTESALSAVSAHNLILSAKYDLIILDINLPDGNGFDLCREIKVLDHEASIIFLTANDMERDMIKGFELGAADYVTKPFPVSVFLHKVAVLCSRINKETNSEIYKDGNLYLNFTGMTASMGGDSLMLTPLEFRMLKIFVNNPRVVLTRQLLMEKLWDTDGNFVEEHALTSNVSRLRGKLETGGRKYLKTIYGMGYMWIGSEKYEL